MATKFTAKEVKQKLLNRKRHVKQLNISLPDLEELDGCLAIQELTAKDVEDADTLSRDRDGKTDENIALGTLIARSLVLLDTKERIFDDVEGSYIAENFGILLLLSLGEAVKEFSGISPQALENIRKNLRETPGSDSATSSEEK